MSQARHPLLPATRRKAGHYEILGETYAKMEFFENGWNPYSRFLDVDKVDLILRRTDSGRKVFREVQVKYGKLYVCKPAWERALFDLTSWRFFKEDEFKSYVDQKDLFVAYVLAADVGYRGDIFIFPVRRFAELVLSGIASKGQRKVYISRVRQQPDKWVLRRAYRFAAIDDRSCVDVSQYRRDFSSLLDGAV
jgi:hypothetical protein